MARVLLKLVPEGYQCRLEDCPPGLFVCDGVVGLKTEYGEADGDSGGEAYIESGEWFAGSVDDTPRKDISVQPAIAIWCPEE